MKPPAAPTCTSGMVRITFASQVVPVTVRAAVVAMRVSPPPAVEHFESGSVEFFATGVIAVPPDGLADDAVDRTRCNLRPAVIGVVYATIVVYCNLNRSK